MALRSLGQSLIAKSLPGARYREATEQAIAATSLPDRGKVGGLDRAQVEEPLERAVSPGSRKIVGAGQPIAEGQVNVPLAGQDLINPVNAMSMSGESFVPPAPPPIDVGLLAPTAPIQAPGNPGNSGGGNNNNNGGGNNNRPGTPPAPVVQAPRPAPKGQVLGAKAPVRPSFTAPKVQSVGGRSIVQDTKKKNLRSYA